MSNWSPLHSNDSSIDMAERLRKSIAEASTVVIALRNTGVDIQNTYINARGDGRAVLLVDLRGDSSWGIRLEDIDELRAAIKAYFPDTSRWTRKFEIYGKRRVVIG